MPDLQTLMTGIAMGESPRWHDERLWFADWGVGEIIAVDLDGASEVVLRRQSLPLSIDWLPDGRLLLVSGRDGVLLRRERDGTLVTHADLSRISDKPSNEIVVDGRGNAYVGTIGFDFTGGEFAPGSLALVSPNGSARVVADGLAFPTAWPSLPTTAR
jgi:sugar lactone lactonase YvrE